MSEDTTFKPFVPPAPMFEEGKPAAAGKPAKPKRERKPRPPLAGKPAKSPKKPAAPQFTRPKRKKTGTQITKGRARAAKRLARPLKGKLDAAFKATREAMTQNLYGDKKKSKACVHKVDLGVALQIGAMLKPTDLKTFGEIEEHLRSVNKSTRRRVLAAIGKVFG